MARRRDPDKPVERLRSSWDSTADLEETLASMFHQETVPGDKLPPIPEVPVVESTHVESQLGPKAPDSLTAPTPDNLTGPLYETLDGLVVDAKCIRPFDAAQHGHTLSEHLVYTAMWRLLGSRGPDADSREGLLPMRLIAAKVSLSVRNLRRVLHSLMDKLAVDVTEYEDKTKSIPRRYRVWAPKTVVDRRRRAGYTHVYRSRNLITLAKPHANLSRPS
jgi:hypothetical protein